MPKRRFWPRLLSFADRQLNAMTRLRQTGQQPKALRKRNKGGVKAGPNCSRHGSNAQAVVAAIARWLDRGGIVERRQMAVSSPNNKTVGTAAASADQQSALARVVFTLLSFPAVARSCLLLTSFVSCWCVVAASACLRTMSKRQRLLL